MPTPDPSDRLPLLAYRDVVAYLNNRPALDKIRSLGLVRAHDELRRHFGVPVLVVLRGATLTPLAEPIFGVDRGARIRAVARHDRAPEGVLVVGWTAVPGTRDVLLRLRHREDVVLVIDGPTPQELDAFVPEVR